MFMSKKNTFTVILLPNSRFRRYRVKTENGEIVNIFRGPQAPQKWKKYRKTIYGLFNDIKRNTFFYLVHNFPLLSYWWGGPGYWPTLLGPTPSYETFLESAHLALQYRAWKAWGKCNFLKIIYLYSLPLYVPQLTRCLSSFLSSFVQSPSPAKFFAIWNPII